MENIILDFVRLLRRGGMKIALSEINDALFALAAFGIEDEKKVYQILRATLLKNESDRDIFDLTYRLYFKRTPKLTERKEVAPCHGGDIPMQGTAGMSPKAKAFYGALYRGDAEGYLTEINEALETPLDTACPVEELLRQLKVTLSWFMVENAMSQTENREGLATLKELETYMRYGIEQKLCAEDEERLQKIAQDENLVEKDLSALTEMQVKAMEQRVGKLANKLAAKYSYRLKPAKSGVINMRKVLAETAKRGYPPAKMSYLHKEKNRPSLIVLCDISASMANYSSFFLQLVYAMERSFEEIQSFLFVENITKANFPKGSNTVQSAVAATIAEAYVPRTGRTGEHCTSTGVSDYGKVFYRFLQKYGDLLNDKTSVFIMGDAKSNWFPPNKEDLKTIGEKSKALYWLNPEPKERWNTQDSIIGTYAPYCNDVYECRNLLQLEKIGQLFKN